MYTDWKRLQDAMGDGWKGMVQPIEGIIDQFDCAINLTEHEKAGCYVDKEMFREMQYPGRKTMSLVYNKSYYMTHHQNPLNVLRT